MHRITVLLAALLVCVSSFAQQFDPEHRHSIEVSTGIPPLQTSVFGSSISVRMERGFSEDRIFCPSFNIAYTYAMSERWDLNVIVNGCGAYVRRSYYPYTLVTETTDDGYQYSYKQFDFKADPESTEVAYSGTMYTPMVNFRWKWLRRDKMRLYSSFGLGCLVLGNFGLFIPTPYLTPVGVNFGAGHIYGIAELNLSCASTGLLAGVGYRF